jgi:hypothetical protein
MVHAHHTTMPQMSSMLCHHLSFACVLVPQYSFLIHTLLTGNDVEETPILSVCSAIQEELYVCANASIPIT